MKSKRLRVWAQLAEIISGVAVVITLVFLVVEVRENTDLVRATTFDRNMESLIDWRMQIVSNENSLKTMADFWGIEDSDALRQQLLVVNMWSIYEKTYYAQRYGLIGKPEWERFENVICRYTDRGPDFWRDKVSQFLTREFRDYVIDVCAIPDA